MNNTKPTFQDALALIEASLTVARQQLHTAAHAYWGDSVRNLHTGEPEILVALRVQKRLLERRSEQVETLRGIQASLSRL